MENRAAHPYREFRGVPLPPSRYAQIRLIQRRPSKRSNSVLSSTEKRKFSTNKWNNRSPIGTDKQRHEQRANQTRPPHSAKFDTQTSFESPGCRFEQVFFRDRNDNRETEKELKKREHCCLESVQYSSSWTMCFIVMCRVSLRDSLFFAPFPTT